MRTVLSALFFAMLVGFSFGAGTPADDKALSGSWIIESATDDGEDEAMFKGARLTFKDGKVELKLTAGEKLAGTYKLDPAAKPKAIDLGLMVGDFPIRKQGLYSLDKDALTICLAMERDAERPGKLEGSTGSKCSLWKLKRAK